MQQPIHTEKSGVAQLTCLGPHDHPCLIYETPDEQADAFVPYLHAGLLQGEMCVYVVDETHPEFIRSAFRHRDVDLDPFVKSGAFKIITKHDAYLTEGYFDIPKMMQFWKETVEKALKDGYTAVRAAAEMTWSLGAEPGNDLLVPYESELNDVFPKFKVSALCQYHRKRFPAKTIKDMIHIHPIVVANNQVLSNPNYLEHNEFIQSHDEMEVQKLLDTITLANQLQKRNKELEDALEAKTRATSEAIAAKRLQTELEIALEKEREVRRYAENLKAELQEFVDNATEGLHWVGPDGTILWANKAELDLMGYSEEEYVGRNMRDFYCDPAEVDKIFDQLKQKQTLRNFAAQLKAKDGSHKSVLINSNVFWKDGQFVHTQCFTRDITDLELAKQKAAQAEEIRELNEELHLLARVVSHELQEPIAKIRSYLNLLAVRYKGRLGSDADEFIEICTNSAKVVHRMVEDLWLFARLTKAQDSDVSVVDANAVVARVLNDNQDLISATNAEITVGALPKLEYSEKQLFYVFDSLINNALVHRRQGMDPKIRIDAELRRGEWKFSVRDNGIGIDPMNFREIFKAFCRINAKPGEGGTGMGLAICQKIVQSRNGRIWLESAIGNGSTFYFTIPVDD
jgi:PAS domain S-box-containing protein